MSHATARCTRNGRVLKGAGAHHHARRPLTERSGLLPPSATRGGAGDRDGLPYQEIKFRFASLVGPKMRSRGEFSVG